MTRERRGYQSTLKHSYRRVSNLPQSMYFMQCLPRSMLGPDNILLNVKFLGKMVQKSQLFYLATIYAVPIM